MKRAYTDTYNIRQKKANTDFTAEECFTKYDSLPPLQRIAAVRIVTELYKQSGIKRSVLDLSMGFSDRARADSYFSYPDDDRSFAQIDKSIKQKISHLPLPPLLKAEISNIINPIKVQLLKWIGWCIEDIAEIHWTIEATIDTGKTLKQLIDKYSGRYLEDIFEECCQNCLESSIFKSWNKLPKETQNKYLTDEEIYKSYYKHLTAYWICVIRNNLHDLLNKITPYDGMNKYNWNHSVYKNMLNISICLHKVTAVKYFWNKLSFNEKSLYLPECINDLLKYREGMFGTWNIETCGLTDVLLFLLSMINEQKQQIEIFKTHRRIILNLLISNWPWQRFLLSTLKAMWEYIDVDLYCDLLSHAIKGIKSDKNAETLVIEIWRMSPISLRKCFTKYIMSDKADTLCHLLFAEDVNIIKALLHHTEVGRKNLVTSSAIESDESAELIYTTIFDVLEEIPSEPFLGRIDLKEHHLKMHGRDLWVKWVNGGNFKMVEKFFTWACTPDYDLNNFKHDAGPHINMVIEILITKHDFELVDKFLNWCYTSEREISKFKNDFVTYMVEICKIGIGDWSLFEKFLDWCSLSDEDLKDFKYRILNNDKLIFSIIKYRFDFDFIDKLVTWCCPTKEAIKAYKGKFVLSSRMRNLVEVFANNCKLNDNRKYSNWELTKNLIHLFSPLEDEVVLKWKQEIAEFISFHNYKDGYTPSMTAEHLFRLIDNANGHASYPEREKHGSDVYNQMEFGDG